MGTRYNFFPQLEFETKIELHIKADAGIGNFFETTSILSWLFMKFFLKHGRSSHFAEKDECRR
jgi:hypothetical protein